MGAHTWVWENHGLYTIFFENTLVHICTFLIATYVFFSPQDKSETAMRALGEGSTILFTRSFMDLPAQSNDQFMHKLESAWIDAYAREGHHIVTLDEVSNNV